MSLARSSDLSWQQFADNDVVMFSPIKLDQGESATACAARIQFRKKPESAICSPLRVSHRCTWTRRTTQESDGEGLELVLRATGANGSNNDYDAFWSNHAWG